MANLTSFATFGGIVLAGTALGIHLGNESLSEINPVHFQEPPTRFHSDLSAYQSPAAGGYALRMDAATPLELGTGCIGCRSYPEEYYPARDSFVDRAVEGSSFGEATVHLASAEVAPDAEGMQRRSDLDRLQRYASYTVEEGQEREPPPAPVETAPAESEATAIQGDEVASTD